MCRHTLNIRFSNEFYNGWKMEKLGGSCEAVYPQNVARNEENEHGSC